MRRALWIAIVALAAMSALSDARAEEVDLELVLAVDVSTSIDEGEFALQRNGYAQAFLNPDVIAAIRSGPHGRIAVAYVEWAAAESQRLVVPWTVLSDAESGTLFAEEILAAPRSFKGWTSISGAIDFAMEVFATNPHSGTRRVIDVSGDGINNSGRPAETARDEAVAHGITINGIVIMNDVPSAMSFWRPDPALDDFYRDRVIGGPGAFVIVVEDFTTFGHAIRNKLLREIAGRESPARYAATLPGPDTAPPRPLAKVDKSTGDLAD
jgi:hypothetical protein